MARVLATMLVCASVALTIGAARGLCDDGGVEVADEHRAVAANGPALPVNPGPGDRWIEPVTGIEFTWLPEGCFTRGTPADEKGRYPDEGPAHRVCVKGFWFGVYPVTNAQYRVWRPGHDSRDFEGVSLDGDNLPVVHVSWNEAHRFTLWLTGAHDKRHGFWLPSESEWEYACRAGTRNARYWGDSPDRQCEYANGADLAAKRLWSSWDVINCHDGFPATSPVGSFKPNGFGLYDMIGNVWEWCTDWKGKYPAGRLWNPTGPIMSNYGRVVRGGSWDNDARGLRCGNRSFGSENFHRYNIGFRVGITAR